MTFPADVPTRVTSLATVLRADNPGPMTLEGTNTYLLAAAGSTTVVVVDPGPLLDGHLAALAALPVELILLTHGHPDHSDAASALAQATAAPVRALDPVWCIGADPVSDGERIDAAGVAIEVLATPGHTADSICLLLPGDDDGSVLTGDSVLGRGTTVIDHPGGTLRDYLASLQRLQALGPMTVLPAHGPVLPDLAAVATEYLQHRAQRLDQVRQALQSAGAQAGATEVVDIVYPDVPAEVRRAAELSVLAQLRYLRD